jgi:hypothetical protein
MFNIPLLPLIGDPLFDDTPLSKKTLPRPKIQKKSAREGKNQIFFKKYFFLPGFNKGHRIFFKVTSITFSIAKM